MAERSRTGYVMAFPFEVKKPKSGTVGVDSTEHDHQLWGLRGAYDSVVAAREQLLRAKAEIDQKLADGDLGVKGHAKALKALRDEYHAKLDAPRKVVEQGRKYGEKVLQQLSAPTTKEHDGPMTRSDYRAKRARERAVDRFTQLAPTDRRNAIRVASEKKDWGFLQMLLDEPALLDAQTAKAIETDIARNSNPYAFQCWQDLHGQMPAGATEPDGLTGALSVTSYVIDSTAEWLDKEANIESTMAERLAAQAAEKAGSNGGTEGSA